jgi:hypothetical protein
MSGIVQLGPAAGLASTLPAVEIRGIAATSDAQSAFADFSWRP